MALNFLQSLFQRFDSWRAKGPEDEPQAGRKILCTELEDRTLLSAVPIDPAMIGAGGGRQLPPDVNQSIAPPPSLHGGSSVQHQSQQGFHVVGHSSELVTTKSTNTNSAKLVGKNTTNAEQGAFKPLLVINNDSESTSSSTSARRRERRSPSPRRRAC